MRNNALPERQMYSSHSTRNGVGLDTLFQWGDHVCHFFRSAHDLADILIPYFKAGLERNEFCVWVTSDPYGKDRATSELRAAVGDFDKRSAAGQIQILGQDEWYAMQAALSAAERIRGWLSRKDEGIALGYAGLRCSGNASFVDQGMWEEFLAYERAVNDAFKGQAIIGLCSYGLDTCLPHAVADVMHCHALSLAKCHDCWRLIEIKRHDSEDSAELEDDHFAASERQKGGVRRLVEDQLAVYIGAFPDRIALHGDHVQLSRSQAAKLGVLVSQLVANSARYGALSSIQGKLAVHWSMVVNGSRNLHITWTETGISGLSATTSIGQGTHLIAAAMQSCIRDSLTRGAECGFEIGPDMRSLHVRLPAK
jgi:hypothetical protein